MGRRRQNRGDADPFDRQGSDPEYVANALFRDLEAIDRPTVLRLDEIRTDGGTQPREKLDQELIEEYAEAISGGAVFPPIEVFYDGENYWLVDGFHRLHAHELAGKRSIRAVVKQGDQRAAILYSLGVNAEHGKRRTNQDKRRAVTVMLSDPEWGKWSAREIARQCRVSNRFVSNMINELSVNSSQIGEKTAPKKRKVKRGDQEYTMKTKRAKKAPQRAPEPPESHDPEPAGRFEDQPSQGDPVTPPAKNSEPEGFDPDHLPLQEQIDHYLYLVVLKLDQLGMNDEADGLNAWRINLADRWGLDKSEGDQ